MQDAQGLLQLLKSLVSDYEWEQGRPLSTVSLSRLLSNYLYYRRSFPYYTHNVVAGLDAAGTGAVYGYDSVGSFERVKVKLTVSYLIILNYTVICTAQSGYRDC
jgi:20S proteasome subunit beta 6